MPVSPDGSIPQLAVSIADLHRIGGGLSADVFRLDAHRVLKLMRPDVPVAVARRECAVTQVAADAGLAIAHPRGLVMVGKRCGLLLDYLPENPVLRRVRRWPGAVMVTLAALARYQAAIHRLAPAGGIPHAADVLAHRLGESLADAAAVAHARTLLAALPPGDRLLHGDLHMGNIITMPGGLRVVDWSQAMIGVPAADVARTELLLRYGRYGRRLRDHAWLRSVRHGAAAWYLTCYRRITGMTDAQVDAWRTPVAVAWLREGSAAHAPSLRRYIAARIARDQLR